MNSGLETLICVVEGRGVRSGYERVELDLAPAPVFRGAAMVARVFPQLKKTRIYEVKVDSWEDLDDLEQVLKVFTSNEDAKIRYRLRVMVRKSRAAQVVQALGDDERAPGEILREVLLNVVNDRIRRLSDHRIQPGDTLARSISDDREGWERDIEREVLDQLGLDARIIFDVDPQAVEAPEIAVRQYPVRVSDAPSLEVMTTVHMVLERIGGPSRSNFPMNTREREARMRQVIASAFRNEVMLYDCWFDRPNVERILREHIDRALQSSAYRCRMLQLEPIPARMLREENVTCTVSWKGPSGRQIDFHIEAVLGLKREGTELCESLNLKPRATWLADEARQAVDLTMHGRDIWDLTLAEQKQVADELQTSLATAASKTGQTIKTLPAQVVLPESRWLDWQSLEVAGETFKTKDSLGEAEFDIQLRLKFLTLRPLADFIRQQGESAFQRGDLNTAIQSRVLDLIRRAVALEMSQIELADYFGAWDAGGAPDSPAAPGSVRNRVIQAIMTELEGRFGQDKGSYAVSLRRVDRKVGEINRAMMALGTLQARLSIQPSGFSARSQLVPVTVTFTPVKLALDRIPDTLSKGRERLGREEVVKTAETAVRQFLTGRPLAGIRNLSIGRVARGVEGGAEEALWDDLERYVSDHVVKFHGFSVQIADVVVDYTAKEDVQLDFNDLDIEKSRALIEHEKMRIAAQRAYWRAEEEQGRALRGKLAEQLMGNSLSSSTDILEFQLIQSMLNQEKKSFQAQDDGPRNAPGLTARREILLTDAREVRREEAGGAGEGAGDATTDAPPQSTDPDTL